MFYVLTLIYETVAIFRVILSVFHFRYGQKVYRRLKRRYAALNTAEYGRGVELDVYYAKDFIEITKKIQPGERRFTETASKMTLDDLTCSICLDSFVLKPD